MLCCEARGLLFSTQAWLVIATSVPFQGMAPGTHPRSTESYLGGKSSGIFVLSSLQVFLKIRNSIVSRMTLRTKIVQMAKVGLTFFKDISIKGRMWSHLEWASFTCSEPSFFSLNLPRFQEDGLGIFNCFILSLLSRDITLTCLPIKTVSSYPHNALLRGPYVLSQCWYLDIFLVISTPEHFVSLRTFLLPWGALLEHSQLPLKLSPWRSYKGDGILARVLMSTDIQVPGMSNHLRIIRRGRHVS